jgi:hypothetical protein
MLLEEHTHSASQRDLCSELRFAFADSWYDWNSMQQNTESRGRYIPVLRAVLEIACIVFLFYSNLLMGEFTVANGQGKTLAQGLHDIFTRTNFVIAMLSAMIGYVAFEYFRKKL